MEETLGKRIVAHRKRLGLTQDRLAELLGVTAQAVSKWENDQSCPDITMLPKLAEVFGITTDELLGIEKQAVHTAEVMPKQDANESNGSHFQNGNWEFQLDGSQKVSLGFALWILLSGGLLLSVHIRAIPVTLWDILWPTGLLLFGLFGLYPKFSFFRLGCGLFGGYCLLNQFGLTTFVLGKELLLSIFLLLFGLSLLVDTLKGRRSQKGTFFTGKRSANAERNYCTYQENHFECVTCFGDNHYLIQLSRLSGGSAKLCFGELTVDLSGCEEIEDGCTIALESSFGTISVLIPSGCLAKPVTSTAFASVSTKGSPDSNAAVTVNLQCNASFGEIVIRYI